MGTFYVEGDDAFNTDSLRFHGEMEVDWEDTVEVTDNPVPLGEPATWHKEKKARTYSLRLIMNDTPLEIQEFDAAPPGERWDSKVEAWFDRHLMDRLTYISANLGVVRGLDVESISRGRKPLVGRTIYDIKLKQVRYAEAQTVRLPPPRKQKKKTTNPPVDKGPVPTAPAPPRLQSENAIIYLNSGLATSQKNSLKYRLTNTTYASSDQQSLPIDAADLRSDYQYAGPYSELPYSIAP